LKVAYKAKREVIMKRYYVYTLKCSDNLLYVGVTNNVERRFEEHQKGLNKSCFTFNRTPLQLIFNQVFNDIERAFYFEKKIKKGLVKRS
jgi:putative endonuclease